MKKCPQALSIFTACWLLLAAAPHSQAQAQLGMWDLYWNSPQGSWKGLLEVDINQDGTESVSFDGLPATANFENEGVEISLTMPKDGAGGEASGRTVKTVSLSGELDNEWMRGTGSFTHQGADAALPFTWQAEKIEVSGSLPPADISGAWTPVTVALSSWRPSPLPMTPANQAISDNFLWYQDEANRCLSPGITRVFSWPYPLQLVQKDEQILAIYETDSIVRRFFIGGSHPDFWPNDNLGFSVANWKNNGRELEIETIHIAPQPMVNTGMSILEENAKVSERIVVSNDGQYLFWIMRVQADESFHEPIIRKALWKRIEGDSRTQIFPYECDPYAFFRDLHQQGLMEQYFQEVRP